MESSSFGKQSLTFEFTKRKRWADLLMAELADGIHMILSTNRTVLYCGPAITELIGWRDVDFLDCDLLDFITPDGRESFTTSFEESIKKNTEFLSYVRLKCNDNISFSSEFRDVAFEIKGYPHIVSDHEQEGRCFFVTAKTYPSRNTTLLNTYLELKTENEQLQKRLNELKSRAPTAPPSTSQSSPIYTTSPQQSQRVLPTSSHSSSAYYPSVAMSSSASNLFDRGTLSATFAPPSVAVPPGSDNEDLNKRKKLKKSHLGEHYVCITCGRTDSPEWRKGPLGPKTLCNACGLRWAKQMRRTDDPAEGGADAPVLA